MGIMKNQIENLNQSVAALAPVHHFLLCGQLHDDPRGIMNKLMVGLARVWSLFFRGGIVNIVANVSSNTFISHAMQQGS